MSSLLASHRLHAFGEHTEPRPKQNLDLIKCYLDITPAAVLTPWHRRRSKCLWVTHTAEAFMF